MPYAAGDLLLDLGIGHLLQRLVIAHFPAALISGKMPVGVALGDRLHAEGTADQQCRTGQHGNGLALAGTEPALGFGVALDGLGGLVIVVVHLGAPVLILPPLWWP